MGWACVKDWIC